MVIVTFGHLHFESDLPAHCALRVADHLDSVVCGGAQIGTDILVSVYFFCAENQLAVLAQSGDTPLSNKTN